MFRQRVGYRWTARQLLTVTMSIMWYCMLVPIGAPGPDGRLRTGSGEGRPEEVEHFGAL
jgi:hypothetical protein